MYFLGAHQPRSWALANTSPRAPVARVRIDTATDGLTAIRRLARLLHPDQQSEEQLRKVAELQMTRLNEIVAVLTDPLRREKYDASIQAVATTQAVMDQRMPPRWRMQLGLFRISIGTIVWTASLVVAAIMFSSALLYFEHGSAVPVYEGSSSQTHPSPATSPIKGSAAALPGSERPTKRIVKADEVDVVTPSVPTPAAQKQDMPQDSQLTTPSEAAPAGHDSSSKARREEVRTNPNPTNSVASQTQDPPSTTNGPNVQNRESSTRGPWVGTWLYSKSSADGTKSGNMTYSPEYIEMIVKTQENGKISGRYLGRYQVPDQALSSEVRFAFEGGIGEGTTRLPWRSSDGAEGQVHISIRIVSDGLLEVTWYTTRFGTSRKLASGTSLLRRD